jgi:hypothetical protein
LEEKDPKRLFEGKDWVIGYETEMDNTMLFILFIFC